MKPSNEISSIMKVSQPFYCNRTQKINQDSFKGTFLSEDTDVFDITPNRRTFFFPETENFNFGD